MALAVSVFVVVSVPVSGVSRVLLWSACATMVLASIVATLAAKLRT
jgi:hypothetical protein